MRIKTEIDEIDVKEKGQKKKKKEERIMWIVNQRTIWMEQKVNERIDSCMPDLRFNSRVSILFIFNKEKSTTLSSRKSNKEKKKIIINDSSAKSGSKFP